MQRLLTYLGQQLSFGGAAADDEIEIRTLVSFHGKSSAQYILDITPLNEARNAVAAGHLGTERQWLRALSLLRQPS